MSETIVNKVANSGLVTVDLEKFLPSAETAIFDLREYLFMSLILKEKEYREALKNADWSIYQDKDVAIVCTADAIVPVWAYMLAASYLEPVARNLFVGTAEEMKKHIFLRNIESLDPNEFAGQRVVVKGCGDVHIDNYAYAAITKILRPVAKSIMYGEPCSTVPIYKMK